MSEFRELQRSKKDERQAELAARRAKQVADSQGAYAKHLEVVARFGARPEGTDPAAIFAEKASLVLSFMATMATADFPGSEKIVKEYVAPPKKRFLLSRLLADTCETVHVRGYEIGRTGRNTGVYICEDNRLRKAGGAALDSEQFEPGYTEIVWRTDSSTERRASVPKHETLFRAMPIEDTLVAIAAKHLPQ